MTKDSTSFLLQQTNAAPAGNANQCLKSRAQEDNGTIVCCRGDLEQEQLPRFGVEFEAQAFEESATHPTTRGHMIKGGSRWLIQSTGWCEFQTAKAASYEWFRTTNHLLHTSCACQCFWDVFASLDAGYLTSQVKM